MAPYAPNKTSRNVRRWSATSVRRWWCRAGSARRRPPSSGSWPIPAGTQISMAPGWCAPSGPPGSSARRPRRHGRRPDLDRQHDATLERLEQLGGAGAGAGTGPGPGGGAARVSEFGPRCVAGSWCISLLGAWRVAQRHRVHREPRKLESPPRSAIVGRRLTASLACVRKIEATTRMGRADKPRRPARAARRRRSPRRRRHIKVRGAGRLGAPGNGGWA